MNKFSIVIPTLWKSNRIHKLLDDLIKCDDVDEIIIIDNNKGYYNHYDRILDKVNLIQMDDNIYVNPAWNLGVSLSKNYSIALVNDDINFNTIIFKFLNSYRLDRFGIIGMDTLNYKTHIEAPKIQKEDRRNVQRFGWGCFIAFDKKYWIDIPDNIKLWYGDDFIRMFNNAPVSYITDFKIETDMSTTSGDSKWVPRKILDAQNFNILLKTKIH